MICLEHFSKNYSSLKNEKNCVDDVSFLAEDNQITGLLGLNGAGKTTILKAICALHYPSSGDIFVFDKDCKINTKENPVRVKKIVGYLSEQPFLYDDFTVYEFLKTVSDFYNSDKLEDAIKNCELSEVLKKKIAALSKGYRQRVSFARLLIQDPSVMLLDEPSDGLDPSQIYKMKQLILKLAKTKTILFSTHNISEAESLCNKICVLSKGKLVATGTAKELVLKSNSKDFEEAFLKITGALNE